MVIHDFLLKLENVYIKDELAQIAALGERVIYREPGDTGITSADLGIELRQNFTYRRNILILCRLHSHTGHLTDDRLFVKRILIRIEH